MIPLSLPLPFPLGSNVLLPCVAAAAAGWLVRHERRGLLLETLDLHNGAIWIHVSVGQGGIWGRGLHGLELDGAKGGDGVGDRGGCGAGLVDEGRKLLVAGGGELDEDTKGAAGAEDGGEVVKGEGDEEGPGGPLWEASEPGGNDDGEGDEVGLAEENGHGRGEHGRDANGGEVEEEDKCGDGIEGESGGTEEGEEDGAAHGGEDEEGGEADVVPEEAGEAVVVEDDEERSSGGDKGDEGGSVEESTGEPPAGRVGRGLVIDEGGSGGSGGGSSGGVGGGGGEGGDEKDDEEHAYRDGGDDPDDLDSEGVQYAALHRRPSDGRRTAATMRDQALRGREVTGIDHDPEEERNREKARIEGGDFGGCVRSPFPRLPLAMGLDWVG